MKAGVVDEDDATEHQRKVDVMIDDKLPINCLLKQYADKVTELRVKHNPYLERPYAGAGLSRLYQVFLPEDLQVDARSIRRALEEKGDWQYPDVVLAQFQKLVKQIHDPKVHAAAVLAAAAIASASSKPSGAGRGRGRGGDTSAGRGRGKGGRGSGGGSAQPPATAPKRPDYFLPENVWCKEKTCHINHDVMSPGKPCYRNSQKSVELPATIWNNPAHMERLRAARKENHTFFNLPGEPMPLRGPSATTHSPGRTPADANIAATENDEATPGAMCFMADVGMFDVGSPEFTDVQALEFSHVDMDCDNELSPDMYASGGERHSPGRWYAITGGAHEGTYFVHNYDKQIAAHAGTAGWGVGVHVYGPDEGVYDQDDAQAKVDAHVAACLGACRAGSLRFVPTHMCNVCGVGTQTSFQLGP